MPSGPLFPELGGVQGVLLECFAGNVPATSSQMGDNPPWSVILGLNR